MIERLTWKLLLQWTFSLFFFFFSITCIYMYFRCFAFISWYYWRTGLRKRGGLVQIAEYELLQGRNIHQANIRCSAYVNLHFLWHLIIFVQLNLVFSGKGCDFLIASELSKKVEKHFLFVFLHFLFVLCYWNSFL